MVRIQKKMKSVVEAKGGKRVAVFAGSFDPFTVGHLDIVERAAAMFDSLVILIAQNASKKNLFDASVRKSMVEVSVSRLPNVSVAVYDGLTVNFMKAVQARYLVRGIRNASDLSLEQAVAWNNKALDKNIETVFLLSAQEHLAVSSSMVRELLKCGIGKDSDVEKNVLMKFVPPKMVSLLLKNFRKVYVAV